jgi:hypothetical protein
MFLFNLRDWVGGKGGELDWSGGGREGRCVEVQEPVVVVEIGLPARDGPLLSLRAVGAGCFVFKSEGGHGSVVRGGGVLAAR